MLENLVYPIRSILVTKAMKIYAIRLIQQTLCEHVMSQTHLETWPSWWIGRRNWRVHLSISRPPAPGQNKWYEYIDILITYYLGEEKKINIHIFMVWSTNGTNYINISGHPVSQQLALISLFFGCQLDEPLGFSGDHQFNAQCELNGMYMFILYTVVFYWK